MSSFVTSVVMMSFIYPVRTYGRSFGGKYNGEIAQYG